MTIEIKLDNPDWVLIRQAAALSLAGQVPAAIIGAVPYLEKNPQYKNMFNDIPVVLGAMNAGSLERDGDAVVIRPSAISGGSFSIDTNDNSSISEAVLMAAPALLKRKSRTALNLTGVTHPLLSMALNQMNDTLFSILQQQGLYSGALLKRYGFHGGGGGSAEVRIYPAEPKSRNFNPELSECEAAGAGVVFSGPFIKDAEDIREIFSGEPGFNESMTRILDVRDSSGSGFFVYTVLHVKPGGCDRLIPLVTCSAADTSMGRENFDRDVYRVLSNVIDTTRTIRNNRLLPVNLVRELMVYPEFSHSRGIERILKVYRGNSEIEATACLVRKY